MSEHFRVWDDNYKKMGVTARELYMRQNGECWLLTEVGPGDTVTIYCTDGQDKAETAHMLNPTYECVRCMMRFTTNVIQNQLHELKP